MKVILTLETGEHVTGDLYAVEVAHEYSGTPDFPHIIRAHIAEITSIVLSDDASEFNPSSVTIEQEVKSA